MQQVVTGQSRKRIAEAARMLSDFVAFSRSDANTDESSAAAAASAESGGGTQEQREGEGASDEAGNTSVEVRFAPTANSKNVDLGDSDAALTSLLSGIEAKLRSPPEHEPRVREVADRVEVCERERVE